MDSSTSSTETTSPPVKRKPLPPQGGARKALLRWVQQTATKYVASQSLQKQICFTHCSLMHHLYDFLQLQHRWVMYSSAVTLWSSVFSRRLGLEVKDFGPSWRTGLAFFAVIHSLRPNLVDMERVWGRPNRENLQEAFCVAETELGIPQLLDPEGKQHFPETSSLSWWSRTGPLQSFALVFPFLFFSAAWSLIENNVTFMLLTEIM